jgi:hypothetical protein
MALHTVTDADLRVTKAKVRDEIEELVTRELDAATCAHRFYGWRDDLGRLHEDIPRCSAIMPPRRKYGTTRDCRRKGVVKRREIVLHEGVRYFEREHWFCLQHDPVREAAKRAAGHAGALFELVREALALVQPSSKTAAAWRDRAERVIARAEGR